MGVARFNISYFSSSRSIILYMVTTSLLMYRFCKFFHFWDPHGALYKPMRSKVKSDDLWGNLRLGAKRCALKNWYPLQPPTGWDLLGKAPLRRKRQKTIFK